MNEVSRFREQSRDYTRRYALGRAGRTLVGTLATALVVGAVGLVLVEAGARSPRWPFYLFAPVVAGFAAVGAYVKSRRTEEALRWLDRSIAGGQRFQAAREALSSSGRLRNLVIREGRILFDEIGRKPPRPEPYPTAIILAIVLFGLCVVVPLIGLPFRLFRDPEPVILDRGIAMESWADRWAATAGEERSREDRELAERMKRLGRRLAQGEMSEPDARKALDRLEEDIEKRIAELERGFLARRLEEDYGIDRETAETFLMRTRRIPLNRLELFRRRILDSSNLDDETRRRLEEILGDPELRTRDGAGDGTPELAEALAEALSDGSETGEEWREALDRTRDTRDDLESGGASEPDAEEGSGPDGSRREGDVDGLAEGGTGFGENDDPGSAGDERTGGSGRGETPVPDGSSGSRVDGRFFGGEMNLEGPVGEGKSWRTVVRAYSEEGESTVGEAPIDPAWRREAEAVIRRENVPAHLRDYVEDYFFALEEGR